MTGVRPGFLLLGVLLCIASGHEVHGASLSRAVHGQLSRADQLTRQERYGEARRVLDELLESLRDEPYGRALAEQTYAYTCIGQGAYREAVGHLRKALQADALPEDVGQRLRYTLAQLLFQEGDPGTALETLMTWLDGESNPRPEARVLLAQVYRRLRQWLPAMEQMRLAMAQAKPPPESWSRLLVALYLEGGRYREAAALLESLVRRFPDQAGYWEQWVGALQRLGRNREAAAALALAEARGLLGPGGVDRLARMYLALGLPLRAGDLLERAMAAGGLEGNPERLSLLADAWVLARERDRALKVLERLAPVDSSGSAELRIGALLFEEENWAAASRRLQRGLERTGKSGHARDWLLLGVARLRLGEQAAARSAFARAVETAGSDDLVRQAARWLAYLDQLEIHPGE